MVSWWWCTSDVECSELIGCSSAGKLQLTWKLTWRIATEPSDSSWAVLKHIAAELPLLQLSWQTAAKLTHHDWENILRLRWQIAKDLALHSWADVLQLVCHSRWQNTLEQIDCSWADKMQLSWHNAGRAGKELTLCSSADWLQPRRLTADGLKNCSGAERCAPELTVWSWLGMWQPSWETKSEESTCCKLINRLCLE